MQTRLHLATLAAVAAFLTPFAPIPTHAQKPAMTENVDEKGRVPYHSFFSTSATVSGGEFFRFRQVPAGFRLVITHVSTLYSSIGSSGSGNYAELTGGTPAPGEADNAEYLPAPVSVGSGGGITSYVVSSPVTYYVEPLGAPSIFVANTFPGSSVSGSVSGYLVALN